MNKIIPFLIMLVFLAGCATGRIVQVGKDTYMINGYNSAPFSSGNGVLADLYEIGNKYCDSKGKKLYSVKTETSNWAPFVRWSKATLTFQCLSENDPKFE